MYTPVWMTNSNLGTYYSTAQFSTLLKASPVSPRTIVTYKLLAGLLPPGLSISANGLLTGKLGAITADMSYTFVVRATDDYGSVSDRSFSMKLKKTPPVKFVTPSGNMLTTVDSVWVNIPIRFTSVKLPDSITVISGKLPDGLYINNLGNINGYPHPPVTSSGNPTTNTSNFTIGIDIDGVLTTRTFSITVNNNELTKPGKVRRPVIVNFNKLNGEISKDDPYYSYYLTSGDIGITNHNDKFAFKVVGHDFDASRLTYIYSGLPSGFVGNPSTGWVTGASSLTTKGISKVNFSVVVAKTDNLSIKSSPVKFNLTLTNNVDPTVTWQTSEVLPTVNNGSVVTLKLSASSKVKLSYAIVDGILPPNISLQSNGDLVGRISYNPIGTRIVKRTVTSFKFTVSAYSELYPLIKSTKQFTLNVYQKHDSPYDDVYFVSSLNNSQREILDDLLSETIIPSAYLYRPNDPNFGKSDNFIKFRMTYGLTPSTLTQYIDAIKNNHYNKRVVMSPLKIAQVRTLSNTVLYEVLYSEAQDDLLSDIGSPPPDIAWPTDIPYGPNNYLTSSTELFTSEDIPTSSTTSYLRVVHPNSFDGMHSALTSNIKQSSDDSLLPPWMTGQQSNGNTIGFVCAWVLCYTLPGKAQIIKDTIESQWGHDMNEFNIVMDRIYVDKSMSYEWNSLLSTPTWSSITNVDVGNSKDYIILFPRNNILPTENDHN